MKHWLGAPARYPIATLLIATILTILSVVAITRLQAETSLNAMLDPTDPATIAMGRVLDGFPVAEELLVMVSLPDEQFDATQLTDFAERLTQRFTTEAGELVRGVRYRPSLQSREFVEQVVAPAGLLYLTDSQLQTARDRLTKQAMIEQFARNEALLAAPGPAAGGVAKAILQDPLRLHELLAERLRDIAPPAMNGAAFFSLAGRDLLIRIEGQRSLSNIDFSTRLTERVTQIVESCNENHLTVRISGGYAIAAHNAGAIRSDAINNSVSTVVLLAIIMSLLYRHPIWTFTVAFVPVATGIVIGFGVYACFRSTVTPLAMVIGGALGGIGIDYTIHLLAHYRQHPSASQLTGRMIGSLLAACATSVIGFAVIGISHVQLLRDFAFVGSLALVGAFIASVTIMPALLSLRSTVATPRFYLRKSPWQRPAVLLVCGGFVLIPFLVVAATVDLTRQDADMHNLHPQPNPPLNAQRDIATRMGFEGGSVMVYVEGDSDEQLIERTARATSQLTADDAKLRGIRGVFGVSSLLPTPMTAWQRQKAFTDEQVTQIVSDFDQAVQQSGFDPAAYANYRNYLPKLLQPAHVPSISDLKMYPDLAETVLPRVSDRHEAILHLFLTQPTESRQQMDRLIYGIGGLLDDSPGVTLTGMSVLSQRTLGSVQRDLPRVAILAIGCVALYLAVHYRSLLLAILAVVPMIVSMIVLVATMQISGLTLNVVNMVMLPLLLGINIDFGIFAVDGLRKNTLREMGYHFVASVQAMTTCAMTTIIGFGSLALTSVPAVRSLGVLVIVGVAGCTLGTLFILWPMVLIIAKRRGIN